VRRSSGTRCPCALAWAHRASSSRPYAADACPVWATSAAAG
jgi:hypothetical protein